MMKKIIFATMLGVLVTLGFGTAQAAEHEVKMLNKGEKGAMVFEPDFIKAEVGDTITFISVDKGHNVVGKKKLLPEGVEPFKSKVSKDYELTVEKEGVYSLICQPHYAMGMVMVVQVGEPVNLEEAKAQKHPGKAKIVFKELLAQVE